MATVRDVGERQLVETIRCIVKPRSKNTVIGPGDDAAVITGSTDGSIVISTDVVTKKRHFPKSMTYEQFGWTAAAVNFSDIASMGARPLGFLPAVTIPEEEDESALYDIMSGIDQCCEFCETDVVGGDTKFGELSVAGTAFGSMEGRKPMTRGGAHPGDLIAVTGNLGDAAAGFYALEAGIDADDQIFKLMVPVPRVEEGIKLASTGIIHSCMDLSDGLANAACTICEMSNVGMEIEWEFIPVDSDSIDLIKSCGKDVKETVTRWGGEYELLFTFDRKDLQKLHDANVGFSIIGLVTDDKKPYLRDGDERVEMQNGIY